MHNNEAGDHDLAHIIDRSSIDRPGNSFSLINRLYADRNRLNQILFHAYPQLQGKCRIVMIFNQQLIIYTSGAKAAHLVNLKKSRLEELFSQYVDFKEIKIQNVSR